MFLKESELKKLVKKAWKNNALSIATTSDEYYLASDNWTIKIKKEFLTNKAKASIIEMTGELPEYAEAFTYGENEVQSIMPECVVELMPEPNSCNPKATCLLVHHSEYDHIIYQDSEAKYLINLNYHNLIDPSAVDEEKGECGIMGPFISDKSIYWYNNVMFLRCDVSQMKYEFEKELLILLRKADAVDRFTVDQLIK